jgi:hypothetical protein
MFATQNKNPILRDRNMAVRTAKKTSAPAKKNPAKKATVKRADTAAKTPRKAAP